MPASDIMIKMFKLYTQQNFIIKRKKTIIPVFWLLPYRVKLQNLLMFNRKHADIRFC